jgi:DNA-binding response OmpR family regulator
VRDTFACFPDAMTLRRRVLVVEDDRDLAEMLCEVLVELGHDALSAHDGPAALAAAPAFQPDLVLLDLSLPSMAGFELCRRFRANAGGAALEIVAVSGTPARDDDAGTGPDGFDRRMMKPLGLQTLRDLCDRQDVRAVRS